MLVCKACGGQMVPANGKWLCALRLSNPQIHKELTLGAGDRLLDRRVGVGNNHNNFSKEYESE